jgi:hypothetical protein
MEQKTYNGPERRSHQPGDTYQGPRRRSLDWPFRPLQPGEREEGNPDKATPGRADMKP